MKKSLKKTSPNPISDEINSGNLPKNQDEESTSKEAPSTELKDDSYQNNSKLEGGETAPFEKQQLLKPKRKANKKTAAPSLTGNSPKSQASLPKSPERKKAMAGSLSDTKAGINEMSNPVDSSSASSPKRQSVKKVAFQLRYHTNMGENIFVTGEHELLGNNNTDRAFALEYLNDQYWIGTLEVPEGAGLSAFAYRYFVKDGYGNINTELASDKYFDPSMYQANEVRLIDSWNFAGHYENTFITEPFKNVLLKSNFTPVQLEEPKKYSHIFRVKAPLLQKGQAVALYGSSFLLGKWDTTAKPVLLSRLEGEDWWTVKIDLNDASFPITYKYGIHDVENDVFVQMEGDKNRIIYDGAHPNKLSVVSDGFAVFANNTFKGAGVAIPVFSLRSSAGMGVGEFNDLKLLVDWASQVGLKVIQILPVNDTTATHTWVDSYPYAAISAFALHPIFLHLPAVVSAQNRHLLDELDPLQLELNALDKVDYERVTVTKLNFIRSIYSSLKTETFTQDDFVAFFDENKHWLVPYAAFCHFRDEFNTPDFSTWSTHSEYNAGEITALAGTPNEVIDTIGIHFFMQYHLHLQLKAATEYAHRNGIIVKGDIPIGIYRNSADAWQEPGLYNMNKQAGAPPDDFAIKGQNWGFPTYNWQAMQADGFSWWKRRFAQMKYYFDAFRIDHILGFFRIWSIPLQAVEGIMGHFVPALPVHKNELDANGIYIDYHRLTAPYINEGILWEFFGDLTPRVQAEFLHETGNAHFALKSDFDNQRKVEKYFEQREISAENERLKYGLFNLISNVILFEEEGSNNEQFHFRIAMESTPSFRYLDEHIKAKLKDLYVNYFFRRQDNFWMDEAMKKLPELKRSTNMLICGEDLGMVPDCVPGVMKQLGILSLEIQRMPKDPTREFFHPNDAPYLSVVTPSTHDMSTIRGWWEEDHGKTERFYHTQLGRWGSAPFFCEPEINAAIIMQHLYSPAMWSIFQLQDLMGMDGNLRRLSPADERINVPANPKHYWQYRMHIALEDLLVSEGFNVNLSSSIKASRR